MGRRNPPGVASISGYSITSAAPFGWWPDLQRMRVTNTTIGQVLMRQVRSVSLCQRTMLEA